MHADDPASAVRPPQSQEDPLNQVPHRFEAEQAERMPVARHGRLGATSVAGSLARWLGMAVAAFTVAVIVLGVIVGLNLSSGVDTFEIAEEPGYSEIPLGEIEGGVNVLLVGSDDRSGQGSAFGEGNPDFDGKLNDVNMVLHISEDRTKVSVVSIPRDLVTDRPACDGDDGTQYEPQYGVQINSILNTGGMNCIISTVEEMSGLDIQYAGMVRFLGVIEMSNAVGGVDVCVENGIHDDDIGLYLDAGTHTLQGGQALQFLRTRHGVVGGSDLARISNQQVFLSALMRKIKSDSTLMDPTKIYGLARAVTQNMTLSSNLNNIDTIASFANTISKIDLSSIAFLRMPVVDSTVYSNRVVAADPYAEQMWEAIANDTPIGVTTTTPTAPSDGEEAGATDAPEATSDGATADDSTGAATSTPAATSVPAPTVDGQTADQETCSAGNV